MSDKQKNRGTVVINIIMVVLNAILSALQS